MNIWQIDPVNITPYYDLALCEALANEGHQVTFVTSKYLYDSKLAYPPNIHADFNYFRLLEHPLLLRFPFARKALKGILYPLGHMRLIDKIRRARPDIIHFQWSRMPAFDIRLVKAIQEIGIPIVHTIHDVEPLFSYGLLSGRLETIYNCVDAFITHTDENHNRFLEHYPDINPESVHTIQHVTFTPSLPENASQVQARELLKIDTSAFVILLFGIIKPYKGLDILAQAIDLVANNLPGVQFWIVGKAEGEQEVQILEQLSKVSKVHIIQEYIPSDEVWKYHIAADLVVFPYRQITQSGALATAIGYGRAVIVTNVGGLPAMVNGNGWVIPPEDPKALAEAMQQAWNTRDHLEQMGRQSLAISSTSAPSIIAQKHIALYKKLIGKTSHPNS